MLVPKVSITLVQTHWLLILDFDYFCFQTRSVQTFQPLIMLVGAGLEVWPDPGGYVSGHVELADQKSPRIQPKCLEIFGYQCNLQ